jgi:hypothetical protein
MQLNAYMFEAELASFVRVRAHYITCWKGFRSMLPIAGKVGRTSMPDIEGAGSCQLGGAVR